MIFLLSSGTDGPVGPPTRGLIAPLVQQVQPPDQSETVMPIERAVLAMIFSAASRSLAFRSWSLVEAISRIWARVSEPTLVLWGTSEPLSRPAALRISR